MSEIFVELCFLTRNDLRDVYWWILFQDNEKYERNDTGKLFLDQNLWRNRLGAKRLTHHDTVYMKIACWVLSIKPKVEIESTLEKTKTQNFFFFFYVYIFPGQGQTKF